MTVVPRFKVTIEYAGTRFSGWQIQKNARTVQGEIDRAVRTVTSRADFESHQEGTGKSPSYVLHVRPRFRGYEPFTLTGPDPADLLREALARLAPG